MVPNILDIACHKLICVINFYQTLDLLINQMNKRLSSFHELIINCTWLQPCGKHVATIFLSLPIDSELLKAMKLVQTSTIETHRKHSRVKCQM